MNISYEDSDRSELETYLGLCTEVYEISKPNPPDDAYNFYQSYVKNANGLVLEPMCGSGRFLLPLLAEGFAVQGFDASKHMLAALTKKAKIQGLHPKVWQGFIETLLIKDRYKLIFIPSGSFGLIKDQPSVETALQTFYNLLDNNGVFLFEGETLSSVPELNTWLRSEWQRKDGKIIALSQYVTLNDNICTSIGKYELLEGNRVIHIETEEYKIRLYQTAELIALLQQTGFKKIRTVKAFNQDEAANEEDEVIIYECVK